MISKKSGKKWVVPVDANKEWIASNLKCENNIRVDDLAENITA